MAEKRDETPARVAKLDRKRFVIGAGALAAGVAAAVVFGLRGDRRDELPLGRLSTIASDFPVRTAEGAPRVVSTRRWPLKVDGLVGRPLTLTAADLAGLPRVTMTCDFHCVEGWTVDAVGWGGVRLAELLDRVEPDPAASFVTFHGYDGAYVDSLTLRQSRDPSVLLADSLDGAPLPHEHGGPVRLVVPAQLGYKNVKWVTRIELADHREIGYWEQRGYSVDAPLGGS